MSRYDDREKLVYDLIAVAVLVVVLGGTTLLLQRPSHTTVAPMNGLSRELIGVRQLVIALRTFAVDNKDRFPETLEELYPLYLDDRSLLTSDYTASGNSEAFIYLPEASGKTVLSIDFSRTPLLISPSLPSPNEDRRIVGFTGGNAVVRKMTAEEVAKMVDDDPPQVP